MKGLFIFLTIISMLFFIAKMIVVILFRIKQDNYYNNSIIKYLNDYTIIAYIILLYAFSISLYLASDYTIAESNFTLIILVIVTALFVGEKVYFSVKNRGYLYIESNIYDLDSISKKENFEGVIIKTDKTYFILKDKEKFESMLELEEKCDSKALLKKRLIPVCLINGLSIVLSIVILVLGLVRGV